MLKSALTRLRETRMREFEGAEAADAGFTLIELMVVLLIIAILLAIAIPTFLGVTGSANDRAAQSNLTNGLTELKALYQNGQTYCQATCASGVTALPLATVQSSAPEFQWKAANVSVAAGNNISMEPVDVSGAGAGDGAIIAAQSKNSSTCWFAVDLESTPQAAFTGGDTGNTQFIAAAAATTAGAQWQTAGITTAAAPAAGVYYAKVVNDNGTCQANEPTASGSNAWDWGTSYANAPTDVVGTN